MAEGKEKPLTRKDVLRLIEENGGTAAGLDLSGRIFKEGINLRRFDLRWAKLRGAILLGAHLEKARFTEADFEGADLARAQLEESSLTYANLKGADLINANLERAHLFGSNLEGTRLRGARMHGAVLRFAKFSNDTDLLEVDWGNYILGEESIQIIGKKRPGAFFAAAESYRKLKMWYTSAGDYDNAAQFYYREMEAKRKQVQEQIQEQFEKCKGWRFLAYLCKRKDFGNWIRLWIYRLFSGYGERPWQVVVSAAAVVFGLALIYFAIGTLTPNTFLNSLYYSAVSFTALGYGRWAPEATGWVKGLGAFEAFLGVFIMALFLITFVRKMTR